MAKKVTKSTTSKIKSKTDNDLGKFLADEGKVEVKPRGKSKVKTEVKTEVKPRGKGEVFQDIDFSKKELSDLGFEIEVLPSGQKTNLSHKQPFVINGFRPMFFRGFYTLTIHYPPDKIYQHIKTIEFV